MRRGDFAAAWRVCDDVLERRRRERVAPHVGPRHLQYVWDGRPVDGARVLVRCYHGLGDTVQFVRFLPKLRARAREVLLWAQPPLLSLLASARGVDRLLPLHDGTPDVDYDVDVELMELPHVLRIDAADLPGRIPYLRIPGSAGAPDGEYASGSDGYGQLPHRDEAGTTCRSTARSARVGLTWRSGDWDASRSLPDALLETLASVPHVEWYALQYGVAPPAFVTADLACRDVAEQARRMQTLDLVVTVDTLTAHLAGALGLPVWTLLAEPCDWRWPAGSDRSPWYPTMRLFRQSLPGDWSSALTHLCDSLGARVRAPVAGHEEFTVAHAREP